MRQSLIGGVNMTEEPTEKKARKKGKRSPGYPMIGLEEAIQRAMILWEKDQNNNIPVEVAYEHLGFKTTAGYAARVIAALKKFGLISERQDDIMLTTEAVDLALHGQNDEHYINTVKILALKPNIYEKIYNECNGNLPLDASLRVKLIRDYEFNASSVDDFIINFRKTLEFAGLTTKTEEDGNKNDMNIEQQGKTPVGKVPVIPPKKPDIEKPAIVAKHYPIPLSKGMTAVIGFETLPVDKKDIEKIKKWLELFADELTEADSESV
jgi:hypothetical protein